jgi:phosphoglycolate phosphatase-like HAD superfamily hydrolase
MRLFLFDLDGTLVSTGGAGMRALSRAFEELFAVKNASDRIEPAGKTDPAIFRELVRLFLNRDMDAADFEHIAAAYLRFLTDEVGQPASGKILPGVASFLDQLKERTDVLVGLGTGNLENGARLKLGSFNLNSYFRFGGFGSDSEDRAELLLAGYRRGLELARYPIAKDDVYILGDTPLDIAAARRAGFRSVGVATGRVSLERLVESGADHALSNFTEGPRFLAEIGAEGHR